MSINKKALGPNLICCHCNCVFNIMLHENEHIVYYEKDNISYCMIDNRLIRCVNCDSLCVKLYYNGKK